MWVYTFFYVSICCDIDFFLRNLNYSSYYKSKTADCAPVNLDS